MITKERLEELIEQGATIYSNDYGEIQLIKENDLSLYENGQNNYILYALEPNKKYHNEIFDEDLFETKEDAEEYAEFGNITRTERLELPSWEDVKKDSETLKYGTYTIAEYKHLFSLNLKFLEAFPTQIVLFTDTEKYGWNLSRENYNEARRLCVKLFKGER